MKILTTILATSLVASVALADGGFVGVSGGYNFVNKVNFDYDDIQDAKGKKPNFGIKAGYDFGSYRAYSEYVYNLQNSDTIDIAGERREFKWSSHDFAVGADFTPEIADGFKAVLGGYIGASYAKAHADDTEIYTTNNAGGFLFGLRVGALYEIDSHSQIELGFKAQRTMISDADLDIYGGYVGYNFKF